MWTVQVACNGIPFFHSRLPYWWRARKKKFISFSNASLRQCANLIYRNRMHWTRLGILRYVFCMCDCEFDFFVVVATATDAAAALCRYSIDVCIRNIENRINVIRIEIEWQNLFVPIFHLDRDILHNFQCGHRTAFQFDFFSFSLSLSVSFFTFFISFIQLPLYRR